MLYLWELVSMSGGGARAHPLNDPQEKVRAGGCASAGRQVPGGPTEGAHGLDEEDQTQRWLHHPRVPWQPKEGRQDEHNSDLSAEETGEERGGTLGRANWLAHWPACYRAEQESEGNKEEGVNHYQGCYIKGDGESGEQAVIG
ncbi:UNVERIFIED_CONTAM: hypothetical protein K2H54_057631 [Gekko kuhli]